MKLSPYVIAVARLVGEHSIGKIIILKKMKKKQKSLPKLKKELQEVFNHFIRLRDAGRPCISCGKFKPNKQAGHYWSVRMYDGLRFDEDNCHGECASCNGFDPCHLIGYTDNLKERIGNERYQELKDRAGSYKAYGSKWSRSELLEKLEYYKQKVKEIL